MQSMQCIKFSKCLDVANGFSGLFSHLLELVLDSSIHTVCFKRLFFLRYTIKCYVTSFLKIEFPKISFLEKKSRDEGLD